MEEKIPINAQLWLRPFNFGDEAVLVQYLNDPVLYRNTLQIPSPYTEADAAWWLGSIQDLYVKHNFRPSWAICHAEGGVIGGIGCFMHTSLDGHRDEIGYWLAAPYRGNGIMTTVVVSFCHWMFEMRPALVRIEAKVHSYNPASARVLEKAGFEREGFARKHTIKNGELIDVVLLARLRD